MEIVSTVKDKAIDPVMDIITGTPDALKSTFTTKEGAFTVGEVAIGAVVGGLTATALTMIPFAIVPFGAELAQAAGLGVSLKRQVLVSVFPCSHTEQRLQTWSLLLVVQSLLLPQPETFLVFLEYFRDYKAV